MLSLLLRALGTFLFCAANSPIFSRMAATFCQCVQSTCHVWLLHHRGCVYVYVCGCVCVAVWLCVCVCVCEGMDEFTQDLRSLSLSLSLSLFLPVCPERFALSLTFMSDADVQQGLLSALLMMAEPCPFHVLVSELRIALTELKSWMEVRSAKRQRVGAFSGARQCGLALTYCWYSHA